MSTEDVIEVYNEVRSDVVIVQQLSVSNYLPLITTIIIIFCIQLINNIFTYFPLQCNVWFLLIYNVGQF